MADGLPMGNLSINDSQHAPQAPANPPGRAAYIPPHMRQRGNMGPSMDASAPPPGPGYGAPRYSLHNSRGEGRPLTPSCYGRSGPRGGNWANANAPDFSPRGPANGNPSLDLSVPNRPFNPQAYRQPLNSSGYGGSYGAPRGSGDGQWRDGKHVPGPANARVERELFGVPNDPSKQQTGINFANYDDIPVEASGMYPFDFA